LGFLIFARNTRQRQFRQERKINMKEGRKEGMKKEGMDGINIYFLLNASISTSDQSEVKIFLPEIFCK
jgi:hypothetical protein